LPFEPLETPPAGPPAWTFENAAFSGIPAQRDGVILSETRCFAPCHGGQVANRVRRGSHGTWIWQDGIGTIHVTPDARRVLVHTESSGDEDFVRALLIGQISILIMQHHGYPTLHASAVQLEQGAIVFLGPQGQGKSTMAASFLRHEGVLVTDDALRLSSQPGGISGGPGLPIMKLWQATADHTLHLKEELPTVLANYQKKLLKIDGRYKMADGPVSITRMYLLDRYDPAETGEHHVQIRRLTAREAHSALIAQTSWSHLLLPAERARLVPVYARLVQQTPVAVLRYPTGFELQESVCDQILADVAA
jgi:hypothetical protein